MEPGKGNSCRGVVSQEGLETQCWGGCFLSSKFTTRLEGFLRAWGGKKLLVNLN